MIGRTRTLLAPWRLQEWPNGSGHLRNPSSTHLLNTMGLDVVEMVMEVEKTFGVEIPDADAERLTTVGSLYDYVATRISPEAVDVDGGPYAGELWERYLDVIERELGVDRVALRPTARFVQDLGAD